MVSISVNGILISIVIIFTLLFIMKIRRKEKLTRSEERIRKEKLESERRKKKSYADYVSGYGSGIFMDHKEEIKQRRENTKHEIVEVLNLINRFKRELANADKITSPDMKLLSDAEENLQRAQIKIYTDIKTAEDFTNSARKIIDAYEQEKIEEKRHKDEEDERRKQKEKEKERMRWEKEEEERREREREEEQKRRKEGELRRKEEEERKHKEEMKQEILDKIYEVTKR